VRERSPTLGHGDGQTHNTQHWTEEISSLFYILTPQGKKTLHTTQGHMEVALRSEQPRAVGGRLCHIKRLRDPLVPVGICDWLV